MTDTIVPTVSKGASRSSTVSPTVNRVVVTVVISDSFRSCVSSPLRSRGGGRAGSGGAVLRRDVRPVQEAARGEWQRPVAEARLDLGLVAADGIVAHGARAAHTPGSSGEHWELARDRAGRDLAGDGDEAPADRHG